MAPDRVAAFPSNIDPKLGTEIQLHSFFLKLLLGVYTRLCLRYCYMLDWPYTLSCFRLPDLDAIGRHAEILQVELGLQPDSC